MPYIENQPVDNWIARFEDETVLEPELPIIDAHHHLWDLRPYDADPRQFFQTKVYLVDDIMADINRSGHHIIQTVFAQCGAFYRADGDISLRSLGETQFVQGMAAMSRSGLYGPTRLCTAMVGEVDLRLGSAVKSIFESHLKINPGFSGIRSAFPSDFNQSFLDGFKVLSEFNLSFDHFSPDVDRLAALAKLAAMFPDVPFIVNHLGAKIDSLADKAIFDYWRQAIVEIAKLPNVYMKVGGIQKRVGAWEPHFHLNQADKPLNSLEFLELLYPYYFHVIDTFGPHRCMFESNYPVERECVSYRVLWNIFKRVAAKAGLSQSEKNAIFHGTAAKVYRLSL